MTYFINSWIQCVESVKSIKFFQENLLRFIFSEFVSCVKWVLVKLFSKNSTNGKNVRLLDIGKLVEWTDAVQNCDGSNYFLSIETLWASRLFFNINIRTLKWLHPHFPLTCYAYAYECKVSSLNSLNEARSFLFSKLLPYHQPSIMHCQLINTLYINYLSFVKNQLPTNFKIFTLYKNFMQLCCVNMCVCVSVLLMQQGLFDRKLLVRKLPSAYDVEERQRKLYENHFISPHTTRIWMVASKQRKG